MKFIYSHFLSLLWCFWSLERVLLNLTRENFSGDQFNFKADSRLSCLLQGLSLQGVYLYLGPGFLWFPMIISLLQSFLWVSAWQQILQLVLWSMLDWNAKVWLIWIRTGLASRPWNQESLEIACFGCCILTWPQGAAAFRFCNPEKQHDLCPLCWQGWRACTGTFGLS